jgi:hypothetical protein
MAQHVDLLLLHSAALHSLVLVAHRPEHQPQLHVQLPLR